ncbi:uncharacterized protein TM35_000751140 [Trypanosoma theileri]|uniref:SAP domain-containing protein n=1 Tax=Trypanosoma theileri TaxID=67003 RepID=A0A1X0NFA6_9TRYP|nr:uncharacterized protein TM35_000751120 [Trypanosoma theileri]XP_028877413.1 uncharacterized protein TM35_000751140 [Trypanosoma theileri]ORC83345.1 hypothetical protein TM35_000751120 [Trypanosoma theileri]ORC83347.1 hypothetical protein TM35_000751140 [Trypanosoma theileri]
MNTTPAVSVLPLPLPLSLLLCLLLVLSSFPSAIMSVNAADPTAHPQQGNVDADTSSQYLAMLKVEDLQQMLHEKRQPFHHLRTKEELIQALVQLEREEELALKVQATAAQRPTQHVLRVLYCSG